MRKGATTACDFSPRRCYQRAHSDPERAAGGSEPNQVGNGSPSGRLGQSRRNRSRKRFQPVSTPSSLTLAPHFLQGPWQLALSLRGRWQRYCCDRVAAPKERLQVAR